MFFPTRYYFYLKIGTMNFFYWFLKTTVNYLLIAIFFSFFIQAKNTTLLENKPPNLITEPLFQITPEFLKRGLWGSAVVKAEIDTSGIVESVKVEATGNSAFDSMVIYTVKRAKFSPAIENGQTVFSSVEFVVSLPLDSLRSPISRLQPSIKGIVIDSILKFPLPDTRVLLYYSDTTADSTVTIGFNRYLYYISNNSDQTYNGTILFTKTDKNGFFQFRGLPHGHYRLSLQAKQYEVRKYEGYITDSVPLINNYYLFTSKETVLNQDYEILVLGKKSLSKNTISTMAEEKRIGFSPYLSNVIMSIPEVRSIPESPSKMLVRSGGPFDNVYVIAGVPMLAPFHFGGHPYADIDGLLISSLSDIDIITNNIAGKRVDASSCIVEVNPEKISYGDDSIANGCYIKGDLSMSGIDLLAAYTAKKIKSNYLQVGYSYCNNYMLKMKNLDNASVSLGKYSKGVPFSYGNATVAGTKSIGFLQSNFFGWLAWDSFTEFKLNSDDKLIDKNSQAIYSKSNSLLPWGMASVKFLADSSKRSLTIGGSHQFFDSGKKHYDEIYTLHSYYNNGNIILDLDTIIDKPIVSKVIARVSNEQWGGVLENHSPEKSDTLRRCESKETSLSLNVSLYKNFGFVTSNVNLLAFAIQYHDSLQYTGDAGFSLLYENDNYYAGINIGSITSRPDSRGLPSPQLRMKLNRTYLSSLSFFFQNDIIKKCGFEPYIRYTTKTPRINPVNLVWDSSELTPVFAAGTDVQFRIVPISWLEFYSTINVAYAKRTNTALYSNVYEWYIPWTIRSGIHINTKNNRFHFYLNLIITKGLPYYDFDSNNYLSLPVYNNAEIKCEFHSPIQRIRFLNQLDCYASLKNIQDIIDNTNVRDYYWDSKGIRQPIFLGNFRMDIGARFGIKL